MNLMSPAEFAHGLRCIECGMTIQAGQEYRTRPVSLGAEDSAAVELICVSCDNADAARARRANGHLRRDDGALRWRYAKPDRPGWWLASLSCGDVQAINVANDELGPGMFCGTIFTEARWMGPLPESTP